jgi:hypothetical protein
VIGTGAKLELLREAAEPVASIQPAVAVNPVRRR